jgi:hypothetical protein
MKPWIPVLLAALLGAVLCAGCVTDDSRDVSSPTEDVSMDAEEDCGCPEGY